jgi:hypothetical protein
LERSADQVIVTRYDSIVRVREYGLKQSEPLGAIRTAPKNVFAWN